MQKNTKIFSIVLLFLTVIVLGCEKKPNVTVNEIVGIISQTPYINHNHAIIKEFKEKSWDINKEKNNVIYILNGVITYTLKKKDFTVPVRVFLVPKKEDKQHTWEKWEQTQVHFILEQRKPL